MFDLYSINMGTENVSYFEKYNKYFLLAASGFIVYLNSLFGPFVWDDIAQIEQNYLVHSITNIATFFLGSTFAPQNSTDLQGLYYRPLMTSAFSLLYTLFGAQTFFYHLLQLSFHVANTLLVFYVFKKFLKQEIAFVLALIFAIHPINAESVVYIATLGEPMFFFFGMIALVLVQKGRATIKTGILISILLLSSLFSKETGILFGIIVFLYYLLFHKQSMGSALKNILIAFAPLALYFYIRFVIAQVHIEKIPDVAMMTAPLTTRILSMPAIFLFYIQTFLFPKDLFIYQQWIIPQADIRFYLPLAIDLLFIGGIAALGIWIFKTNKKLFSPFLFFFLWFLMGIGLHMQFLPLDMTVADHMFYFPIVGLLGIIGCGIQSVKYVNERTRQIAFTCVIIILCLLALRTFVRNTNWYDRITLYSHDLQFQQNDRLENLLAGELITAGRIQEAQLRYESLVSRNPNEPILYANLGQTYQQQGDFKKAKEIYARGTKVDDTGMIYAYVANVLIKEGNYVQAREISNEGLKKFPNNASLLLINAVSSYKLGDKKNATEQIKKAKSISNDPKLEQFYQSILNDNLSF